MPYTQCPGCSVTVYAPRIAFSADHRCPGCDARLSNPPSLFAGRRPRKKREPAPGGVAAAARPS